MSAFAVNSSNFEDVVVKSDVPVLIDFWATWCGPCKMLSPLIEQVAQEADGFKVVSVDVDEEQELAMKFQVSSIPTLVVVENGKEVRRSVGFIQKPQILALLGK